GPPTACRRRAKQKVRDSTGRGSGVQRKASKRTKAAIHMAITPTPWNVLSPPYLRLNRLSPAGSLRLCSRPATLLAGSRPLQEKNEDRARARRRLCARHCAYRLSQRPPESRNSD